MLKHVLIMHSRPWRYQLRDIAQAYLDKGCKVSIFVPDTDQHNYRKCITNGAKVILHPDFFSAKRTLNTKDRQKLFELARSCEKATGRSIGRIIHTGERDVARAYTEQDYYWPGMSLHGRVSKNVQLPEDIVLDIFGFWAKVLQENDIDLVLCRTICDIYTFPFHMLCQKEGIPFLAVRQSKPLTGYVFWTADILMDNTLGRDRYHEKIAADEEPSAEALARIETFVSQPEPAEYILQTWNRYAQTSYFKGLHSVFTVLMENLRYRRKRHTGPKPEPFLAKLWNVHRTAWAKKFHKKLYRIFTEEQLQEQTYAYVPLHKEPEMMLNYRSPLWHTQRHALKFIGSMLPSGYRLLARENVGTAGRRTTRWLKNVARFPRTYLTTYTGSQYTYIRNADLIVTDNGTGGWEGLLLGKPVVTLEPTFFDHVDLAVRCDCPSKLDKAIFQAIETPLAKEKRIRRIALFYDAEKETSLIEKDTIKDQNINLAYIDALLEKIQG